MYYSLYYLHDVNFSEKTKIPIGYQRSNLLRGGNGLYISLWQRWREDYKMSRKIRVREGKEVITVFFSRWINYKVVCCFHEDSVTITKRKLSHSALPLYFLRIECHGTFMEAPKHEKEKKKRQSSLLVYLALQLKGLEVKWADGKDQDSLCADFLPQ